MKCPSGHKEDSKVVDSRSIKGEKVSAEDGNVMHVIFGTPLTNMFSITLLKLLKNLESVKNMTGQSLKRVLTLPAKNVLYLKKKFSRQLVELKKKLVIFQILKLKHIKLAAWSWRN